MMVWASKLVGHPARIDISNTGSWIYISSEMSLTWIDLVSIYSSAANLPRKLCYRHFAQRYQGHSWSEPVLPIKLFKYIARPSSRTHMSGPRRAAKPLEGRWRKVSNTTSEGLLRGTVVTLIYGRLGMRNKVKFSVRYDERV